MTSSLQPSAVPAQWYPPDPPKSAVAAGFWQLFFGWFGLGTFYVGSLGIAFTQLALGILGVGTVFVIVGFFILVPLSIWTFIDAILMFSGSVKDKDGRKIR
jgi:TM2 domain-containing membrane protein YozV